MEKKWEGEEATERELITQRARLRQVYVIAPLSSQGFLKKILTLDLSLMLLQCNKDEYSFKMLLKILKFRNNLFLSEGLEIKFHIKEPHNRVSVTGALLSNSRYIATNGIAVRY